MADDELERLRLENALLAEALVAKSTRRRQLHTDSCKAFSSPAKWLLSVALLVAAVAVVVGVVGGHYVAVLVAAVFALFFGGAVVSIEGVHLEGDDGCDAESTINQQSINNQSTINNRPHGPGDNNNDNQYNTR